MGVLPKDAPDAPETRERAVREGPPGRDQRQEGRPRSKRFSTANALGGKHAVGIATHLVENRFVGIKSRGVYEAPGMELLGSAYAYLLQLVLDRRGRELFDQLSLFVGKQIYQGYGFDLATHMARAALVPINEPRDRYDQAEAVQGARRVRRRPRTCRTRCTRRRTPAWRRSARSTTPTAKASCSVLQVSARALAANGQVTAPAWAKV